jgi:hypothetical protein
MTRRSANRFDPAVPRRHPGPRPAGPFVASWPHGLAAASILPSRTGPHVQPAPVQAFRQSRRPDSNRGPLHYEACACVGRRWWDAAICRQDGRFRLARRSSQAGSGEIRLPRRFHTIAAHPARIRPTRSGTGSQMISDRRRAQQRRASPTRYAGSATQAPYR